MRKLLMSLAVLGGLLFAAAPLAPAQAAAGITAAKIDAAPSAVVKARWHHRHWRHWGHRRWWGWHHRRHYWGPRFYGWGYYPHHRWHRWHYRHHWRRW